MPVLRIKLRGRFWVSCRPGKYEVPRYEKGSITSFEPRRGTDYGRMTGFLPQAFHASCISNMVVMINTFRYGRWPGIVIFVLTPIKISDQSLSHHVPSQAVIVELVRHLALVGLDCSVSSKNPRGMSARSTRESSWGMFVSPLAYSRIFPPFP